MMEGFSDQQFAELEAWLMRRDRGIFSIVELEGLLTAVAIGPNSLSPLLWLPKVWGGKQPKFKDLPEMNHFVSLVMAYYNDIVCAFEDDPTLFEPTFYEHQSGGKRTVIVDEWCVGFIRGMRLDSPGWKPLKREQPELLKPLELFGTKAGWAELEAGGEAAMHASWSVRIAPAVRGIHAFWLPRRRAQFEGASSSSVSH